MTTLARVTPMARSNPLIKISIIFGGLVLACLPFMLKNNVYRTILSGVDWRVHNDVITSFTNGNALPEGILYPAQLIFGAILGYVNRILTLPPSTIFMAFMVVSLLGVGLSIYYIASHIESITKPWIILLVSILCTKSILTLFSYGVIFSIINVYIVLPFAVYFIVKWLVGKNTIHLVTGLILFALFSLLHPTGMYLIGAVAVSLMGLLSYKIFAGKKVSILRLLYLTGALSLLGMIACFLVLLERSDLSSVEPFSITSSTVVSLGLSSGNTIGASNWVYIPQFVTTYLTLVALMLGLVAFCGFMQYRKKIVMSSEVKYLLWILSAFAVAMAGVTPLLGYPLLGRTLVDMAFILALIIGVIITKVINVSGKNSLLSTVSWVLIAVGVTTTLIAWVKP